MGGFRKCVKVIRFFIPNLFLNKCTLMYNKWTTNVQRNKTLPFKKRLTVFGYFILFQKCIYILNFPRLNFPTHSCVMRIVSDFVTFGAVGFGWRWLG